MTRGPKSVAPHLNKSLEHRPGAFGSKLLREEETPQRPSFSRTSEE